MAHYQVYVPAETFSGSTQHPLVCAGLADHVANADGIRIADGPDGNGGMLYAWRNHTTNRRLHFSADEQEWIPAVPVGDSPAKRYWVGIWNDAPPTESDLRRPGVMFGRDVALGNGEGWHVVTPSELPHDLMIDVDGSLKMEPKARYQDLCLEAYRWKARLRGADQVVQYIDMLRFGLRCLSINYRLPIEVSNKLRLIDTENIKNVIFAAMGMTEAAQDGQQ